MPRDDVLACEDFAARLDLLFRTRLRADGKEWQHNEVAASISAIMGVKKTGSYVGQLRAGKEGATNPTLAVIKAVAQHFGVDPGYFLADALTQLTADLANPLCAPETAEHRRLLGLSLLLDRADREAVIEFAAARIAVRVARSEIDLTAGAAPLPVDVRNALAPR